MEERHRIESMHDIFTVLLRACSDASEEFTLTSPTLQKNLSASEQLNLISEQTGHDPTHLSLCSGFQFNYLQTAPKGEKFAFYQHLDANFKRVISIL